MAPKGATGQKGASGRNGTNGTKGSTGGKGQKGDRGIQGVKGATGKSGTNGTQGPKGNPGGTDPKGNPGQKGATGANADSFWTGNKSAEVGLGWVSLVDFHSNRGHADVYAWDNNSSRHSFIQIKATRHYTHANANVVAYSGYTKHITAVRWLEQYKGSPPHPTVYGNKILQIYLSQKVTLYTKLRNHNVFGGQTYVTQKTPVVLNSHSSYRNYGPAIPLGSATGNLATTGGVVSGGEGLQMKTSSGKHGYVQTDANGFARLIGREAGFGLCQYDHNGEIARGQTETVLRIV